MGFSFKDLREQKGIFRFRRECVSDGKNSSCPAKFFALFLNSISVISRQNGQIFLPDKYRAKKFRRACTFFEKSALMRVKAIESAFIACGCCSGSSDYSLPGRGLFNCKSTDLLIQKGEIVMNHLKKTHPNAIQPQSVGRIFLALTLLSLSAIAAMAQSVPRNLNIFDGSGSARYNSTGRAFVGHGTGNVDGRIRDGQLRELHVNFDPDVNGPNRLRSFYLYYTPSAGVVPPSLQWYDNGATKRLVITNVPARQYFSGTAVSSRGLAKVEITFVHGAAGKVVVTYQHSAYSSTPPSNITIRYYNGTVFSASPLAGRRLGYQIL